MVLQQSTTDIDDLWQLIHQADNDDIRYELIDGEIFEMSPPGLQHGSLASEIAYQLRLFDKNRALGIVTVETGYHPPNDRSILLSPDVAFTSSSAPANASPQEICAVYAGPRLWRSSPRVTPLSRYAGRPRSICGMARKSCGLSGRTAGQSRFAGKTKTRT